MNDRFPYTGISQSYTTERERRTLIMPILIGTTLVAIGAFFFLSAPEELETTAAAGELAVTPSEVEVIEQLPAFLPATDETATELVSLDISETPDFEGEAATEEHFTPWLSPRELDLFIREQNEGFEKSFWDRGHWITVAEGRWENGSHEFRIAVEEIPDINTLQWQYRINQTQEEFAQCIDELVDQGYTLVHSQSFERPDQTLRFQGVWQREVVPETIVGN